ncbi:hypothetical protein WJX84_008729 [Apatococcus fuscideae]|uniref:Uncharacterized protein n=1 Tax=Apatococcus fuscideae TaxID=2026836 RepID=A0AAW1T4A9_9CHLO
MEGDTLLAQTAKQSLTQLLCFRGTPLLIPMPALRELQIPQAKCGPIRLLYPKLTFLTAWVAPDFFPANLSSHVIEHLLISSVGKCLVNVASFQGCTTVQLSCTRSLFTDDTLLDSDVLGTIRSFTVIHDSCHPIRSRGAIPWVWQRNMVCAGDTSLGVFGHATVF